MDHHSCKALANLVDPLNILYFSFSCYLKVVNILFLLVSVFVVVTVL